MPYCVTMARASCVALLMSAAAPDVALSQARAEHDLLCDATAHGHGDVGLELGARVGEHVALGKAHDHSKRAPTRDDGRLVHWVRPRLMHSTQRMPALVIGSQRLLLLGHDHGAALGAHQHLVLGVLELELSDEPLGAGGGGAPRRTRRTR